MQDGACEDSRRICTGARYVEHNSADTREYFGFTEGNCTMSKIAAGGVKDATYLVGMGDAMGTSGIRQLRDAVTKEV